MKGTILCIRKSKLSKIPSAIIVINAELWKKHTCTDTKITVSNVKLIGEANISDVHTAGIITQDDIITVFQKLSDILSSKNHNLDMVDFLCDFSTYLDGAHETNEYWETTFADPSGKKIWTENN